MNTKSNYNNFFWNPESESLDYFIERHNLQAYKIAFMHQDKDDNGNLVYLIIFEKIIRESQ
jgi:hypothetical protein